MTDSRPRPEYGEYATPEQQAAAMGRAYVPPPDPEARETIAAPAPGAASPSNPFRLGGNMIDRFITIFQLGIGLVVLLSSDFFHLAENANTDLAELGIAQRIPVVIDQYAWYLLATNIVLLLATVVWAFARLRRSRLAFFVPIVGYLIFSTVLGVAIAVQR